MKPFSLLCGIVIGFYSMGQPDASTKKNRPIGIGDVCPEIEFSSTVNFSKQKVLLSDFEGKAKIIDFWATWCVPCIRNIPKMDSLQKKLASRLQVILVNSEPLNKAQSFFKKSPGLELFSVNINKSHPIFQFFPHLYLPHYIWLDSNNRVYAITGEYEVNEKNILAFLNGNPPTLSVKNDMKTDSTSYKNEEKYVDRERHILYQSVLSGFDSSRQQSLEVYKTPGTFYEHRRIKAVNFSIGHLYLVAYGEYGLSGNQFPKEQVYYILKDPSLMNYPRNIDPIKRKSWLSANTFCYELITSKQQKKDFYRTMQEELDRAFGLKSRLRERLTKCLILTYKGYDSLQTRTDTTVYDTNIYWITIKNQPIKKLIDALRRFNFNADLPVLDETNISHNIDLDIHGKINEPELLKKELNKFGLDLKLGNRKITMLEISDR